MKKVCAFFLLLLAAALRGDSGKCGDNCDWELNDDGTLFIRGSGEMENYVYDSSVPWYSQRDSIKNVKISTGIATIEEWAFLFVSR